MCNAVLRETPPAIDDVRDDVPDGLNEVISRAMAKEAADRYASMSDFAADLIQFASDASAVPRALASLASSPSIDALPSSPRAEKISSKININMRPAGAPALGLLSSDGSVDTWADILHEAPARPQRPLTAIVLMVTVAIVAVIVGTVIL